ncbi:MAG: hypothetical protein H7Z43_13080, partial [Clostridia bacterium]|nr:hypothetical protein [Deltaproteobacteria bacterium]
MVALPFDRVEVGDNKRLLDVKQFLALPMSERIGFILARKCAFYLGSQSVDSAVALKGLRAAT